jgi:hypothetical protein
MNGVARNAAAAGKRNGMRDDLDIGVTNRASSCFAEQSSDEGHNPGSW